MHTPRQEIAQSRVNGALALEAGHARELRGLDLHGEMGFAAAVVAGMAAVAGAVVDDPQPRRSERRAQAFLDLAGDGAGST